MRDIILDLIKKNPKHYVRMIKSNELLLTWVKQNSCIAEGSLPAMIYSAVYQVNNSCKHGAIKKFDRFSTGFINCGPANKCKCTQESISENVSKTKQSFSKTKKTSINQKRNSTMINKYGVMYNSQREDIKHLWTKYKIPESASSKLDNFVWLNNEYNVKKRSLVDIAQELKVYYSTVTEYCKKHGFEIRRTANYSLIEKEIIKFINAEGFDCQQSNWDLIEKEIDVYVPSKKLGIEINGLYWHSFHPKTNKAENRLHHLSKTLLANAVGVELMHVTDYEWQHKKSIIKSMIKSKLGTNQKIYARNCIIKNVTKEEARIFLNNNHLQGYINFDFSLGLYHNNQLVSIMTFYKSRYNKIAKWELLRFCSLLNHNIVGGASKLLNHARKKLSSIISYCDLSKGNGNSYQLMGFKLHHQTKPGYFWTDGNEIFSRYKCQKKQLKKWLVNFDPTLSEKQNMFANNFRRYWDCGNKVFIIS